MITVEFHKVFISYNTSSIVVELFICQNRRDIPDQILPWSVDVDFDLDMIFYSVSITKVGV